MHKKLAFGLVILSGLFLVSCDPDDINGGNGTGSTNYWEQNALVHLQLKGKVKSIKDTYDTEGSYYETQFGEHGEIIKYTSFYNGSDPYIENYEYNSAGQLIKDEYNEYEYGTHGKYIPREFFHINLVGFVKNLTKITSSVDTRLEFDGNLLYVYFDYESPDTLIIEYSGAYPTKIGDVTDTSKEWGEYMKASYQANGMFDEYEEGFYGTGENWYTDSRKSYYKQDSEYLLIDKHIRKYTTHNSEYDYFEESKYTYNSKKDLIKVEEIDAEGAITSETTYEYEYDDHNNWTKKTVKYSWNSDTEVTEREIRYY